jgi:hypothetical protein
MHRTNINLTKRQHEMFSKLAKELGVSLGELVRRLLDKCIDEMQTKDNRQQ